MTRRQLGKNASRLLVDLLAELRSDWPRPAIEAALRSANGPYVDGAVLAQQALAVAGDVEGRSVPDQIGRAEAYYPLRADGSSTSPSGARCEHGESYPCDLCGDATSVLSGRARAEHADAARLAVRAARLESDRSRWARRRGAWGLD